MLFKAIRFDYSNTQSITINISTLLVHIVVEAFNMNIYNAITF